MTRLDYIVIGLCLCLRSVYVCIWDHVYACAMLYM